ncbi:secondary thiamine-phosphate synthase enzyme YjbQ [Candidatus Gracilibacteria bacterium]|nr:secondary thiamine-phosphate synthase enzyme YjbQ [Candidatus Gracilibacteria bacterium]
MQTKILTFKTKKFFDVYNITSDVQKFLDEVKAKDGLVNVFTQHTTVAIKINEWEAGILSDMRRVLFGKIADPAEYYQHNDLEKRDPATICPKSGGKDCLNGHSHIGQMILGSTSETIPVKDGKLQLGTWQQILMFELDHARERELVLSFLD